MAPRKLRLHVQTLKSICATGISNALCKPPKKRPSCPPKHISPRNVRLQNTNTVFCSDLHRYSQIYPTVELTSNMIH